ncbi:TetR/AcrR family transcriptional regulator [Amycolatopsis cihanbeyliensis]|uniref:TetR family transcriptional regulator n=1 Tax=Amycolatopsis cihanbeyliensis TaxID=1128664 RepID=A0A542DI83_AMYCI|nr:TetR family transcriptional regulator [Amycolatopsis cihanbeyliensis]TQJ02808.1 TetR family transcriptional regulator [Amycolatopsis cihanbeyliensis]
MSPHTPAVPGIDTGRGTLPLRERKKLRTRRALTDTALELFLERGFDETTLDELVEAVEVSKRTFFRNFASKEEVALAAEVELWEAYVYEVARAEISGPVLDALRNALSAAVFRLGEDWDRRFIRTRKLVAGTPALRDRSLVLSINVQERLVDVLEGKLGIDGREDVRLRLLGEFSLSAWRCGAKNWVAGRGYGGRRGHGGSDTLVRRVEEAFDAIPDSLSLAVPEAE